MEEEKRIAPRVSFNSAVRYSYKGAAAHSDTVGKSISNSGIGFISNEFIPKNSYLALELHLPWQAESINTLAEVVWITSQPFSERFEVGARFLTPPLNL